MKNFIKIVCCFGLVWSMQAVGADKKAAKKPAAKAASSNWCCMVDGEVALDAKAKDKKLCLKSKAEPSAKSKSKLTKKYVKNCQTAGGAWEVSK